MCVIHNVTHPQRDPGAVQRQEVGVGREHGIEILAQALGGDEGVGLFKKKMG
jgi:hypothetical protein